MKDNSSNTGNYFKHDDRDSTIGNGFYALLSAVGMTIHVFIRKDFGERYLSVLRFITLVVLFYLFSIFYSRIFDASIFMFLTVFMLFYLAHFIMIKLRPYEKEVHSHYAGTSRLSFFFPSLTETYVKMYAEPLVCMIIGIVLFFVYLNYYDVLGLSLYLFFVGLVLFFQAQVEYYFLKEKYLDIRDEVIEKEELDNIFIQLKEPSKTKGVTVAGLQKVPLHERQKLAEMYRNIHPQLRDIDQMRPVNDEYTKIPGIKDAKVKEEIPLQEPLQ